MPEDSADDHAIVGENLTPEADRARAIAAVLRDQEAKEQQRRLPTPSRSTTMPRIVAAGILGITALSVWILPDSWFELVEPVTLSIQVEDASLRMAMYLQAQRIELFRQERGRLPDVLEEAGEPLHGVAYNRMDARTFRLIGRGDHIFLSFVSSDSLQLFAEPAVDLSGDDE